MPVTIAITGIPDDQTLALLDEQIARFEQENPDILVDVVKAPRDSAVRHDAFAARLGEGDSTRDIYVLDPTWLAEFEANGWLAALDEHAKEQGLSLSGFFSSTLEATTLEGQLIALPWAVDGGLSLALSAYSLHPEQAFRFMAFLVGHEQQLQLARLGVMPPALETVYRDPELLRELPFFRDLHVALAATHPRRQSLAYAGISEAIYTEAHKMLLGEQGIAATAENVQLRIEEILDDATSTGG